MGKQYKLSGDEVNHCRIAANALSRAVNWNDTPQGGSYWAGVRRCLRDMAEQGTSDGNPWVEPEPPARVPTDEDAKSIPDVMVLDDGEHGDIWVRAKLLAVRPSISTPFMVRTESGNVDSYTTCRFPNELEADIVLPENCAAEAFERAFVAWITPTDDDARHRPEVEVFIGGRWTNYGPGQAKPRFRLALVSDRKDYPFVTTDGMMHDQCRMRADAPHLAMQPAE